MAVNNKRHRTFGSHNKKASKQPVTFELIGVDEEGNEYSETFTARPKIPGIAVLEFAAAGTGDNGNASVAAIYNFYSIALPQEEYERFYAFAKDPKYDVELDDLVEIIGFLIEEYASRPTEAPSQ